MGHRNRYLDDRGERLRSGSLRTVARAREAGVERHAAARALRRINRQGMLVGAGLAPCFLLVFASVRWALGPGHNMAALVAGGLAFVLLGLALRSLAMPRSIRTHRRGWLDEGLCPGCGYELTHLEPEEDGCRVCPECGAAWKLGDSVEGSTS